jgi:hypothetical protein
MPILNPHGLGLSDAVDGYLETQRKAKEEAAMAAIGQMMAGDLGAAPAASASPVFAPGAAQPAPARPSLPSMAGGGAQMRLPVDPEVESRFIGELRKGGLTNPNGLAAFAAYANAESAFSPKNITGSWSDPSQSGQPGTSGGILSWRGSRLANMKAFTAGAPDPVTAQAKFALTENPDLTVALQNAKTPEEAHQLLANAWKFAGYDQQGGENARRLSMVRSYVPKVGGSSVADLPAANAQAAQGFAIPGQAAPVASVAASPSDAHTRQMIGAMMQVPSMRPQAMALWASIRKGEDTWELGDFGAAGKGFYNKRNPSQRMMIPNSAKMEGYTLGENQARYDGSNNLVAQGPAKAAKPHNVPPGNVVLDENNQPVFRNPKEPTIRPPSASDQKAIREADDAVLSGEQVLTDLNKAKQLSKNAYAGPVAGGLGYVTSFFGDQAGLDTLELDKTVTAQALAQLKSLFGSAPTEGERKVLLDMQGSSSLPHKARVKLYERAEEAATKKLDQVRQRAEEMRSGTYYKPGGGSAASSANPSAPAQDGWSDVGSGIKIRRK